MSLITSLSNPRVKQIVRLREKSSERRRTGTFCLENERELARALDAGFELETLFIDPSRTLPDSLLSRAAEAGVEAEPVASSVLEKMAYRQNPAGFVAVLQTRTTSLDQLGAGSSGLYIVCSGLEKPGNLGAILRSADAAGVDAMLIDSPDVDLFNPNCIRASTGAVFTKPVCCAPREALVSFLKAGGVRVVALTPEAVGWHTDLDMKSATALVVGAEAEGLDDAWRELADVQVAIPMMGRVDSLNVSVAASIMLFEVVRQRVG